MLSLEQRYNKGGGGVRGMIIFISCGRAEKIREVGGKARKPKQIKERGRGGGQHHGGGQCGERTSHTVGTNKG